MKREIRAIVKGLCQTLNRRRAAPIVFHRIGRWWHRALEIDLVALNAETGDTLFVECTWTSSPIDIDVFRELERKAKTLSIKPEQCFYLLASKSGFSPRLRQQQGLHLQLWDMSTIDKLIQGLIKSSLKTEPEHLRGD